jgi:hypothetical protein
MACRYAARVFGGGARLGERGWGADAHAAEAANSHKSNTNKSYERRRKEPPARR